MEKILIKCSSEKETHKVFDYLESIGEKIKRTGYTYTSEWCYVGWSKIDDSWTIAAKNPSWFNFSLIITFEEFEKNYLNKNNSNKPEDILEEAKRRYPVGTTFRVVHKPQIVHTVFSHENHKHNFIYDSQNKLHVNLPIDEKDCASVYFDGEWAEIISLPEKINKYTDFIFEPGNYYVGEWENNNRVIFKTTTNRLSDKCYYISTFNKFNVSNTGCCTSSGISFREANQEEILWLKSCIINNKTMPCPDKKETIPEYVECIEVNNASLHQKYTGKSCEIGRIYKVIETSYPLQGVKILTYVTECGVAIYTHSTKPSTKEAYEAQFKKENNMFKKGEYIVYTEDNNNDGFIFNNCYKQKVNENYLCPELTNSGSTNNGWTHISFNKKNWRYATSEEIAEYDRIGKPYDVTLLSENKSLIGRWVKILRNFANYKGLPVGSYDLITEDDKKSNYIYLKKYGSCERSRFIDKEIELMPEGFVPKEEEDQQSTLSPLEICRQKYKKGMRVRSPEGNSVYCNEEFIINKNPESFRIYCGDTVDYYSCPGWLYYKGEYAEILEHPEIIIGNASISQNVDNAKCDLVVQYPEIKRKPLIENVQSVSVNLHKKTINNKFKF